MGRIGRSVCSRLPQSEIIYTVVSRRNIQRAHIAELRDRVIQDEVQTQTQRHLRVLGGRIRVADGMAYHCDQPCYSLIAASTAHLADRVYMFVSRLLF